MCTYTYRSRFRVYRRGLGTEFLSAITTLSSSPPPPLQSAEIIFWPMSRRLYCYNIISTSDSNIIITIIVSCITSQARAKLVSGIIAEKERIGDSQNQANKRVLWWCLLMFVIRRVLISIVIKKNEQIILTFYVSSMDTC